MLGLTQPIDAWLAYQYDTACARLGRYVALMLDQRDDKGRQRFSLAGLLNDRKPNHQGQAAQRYRTDFDRIPFEAA